MISNPDSIKKHGASLFAKLNLSAHNACPRAHSAEASASGKEENCPHLTPSFFHTDPRLAKAPRYRSNTLAPAVPPMPETSKDAKASFESILGLAAMRGADGRSLAAIMAPCSTWRQRMYSIRIRGGRIKNALSRVLNPYS